MTPIDERVNSLVSQMTLEEKLAQLGSCWSHELLTGGDLDDSKVAAKLKYGIGQITRLAGASAFCPEETAKAANRLQKFLLEETRLGIPAIIHEECCSGAMVYGGTTYPQILGLAATFQPELACAMTTSIRHQLRAIGGHQGLAPVLDIARDPRWGRVEETFGEDPTLVSHFGAAYIQGLQGERLSEGVVATGKHFVAHSYSQGGLNCAPVHIGWREIYEVCFAPFQAAIRHAGLASIMNSYPDLDGEVVAASRRILTDILRKELGFDGVVVSDYEAVIMLHNFHFIAPDQSTAARLALDAGIDVELPTTVCYGDPLRLALESGEIDLETIDRSVARHLRLKMELGLFENPYVDEGRAQELFDAHANRPLAREIARQSMVLLKNDGLLPLPKSARSLAVIGPNAACGRNLLGDYSYASMRELMMHRYQLDPSLFEYQEIRVPSILEAIQAAVSPTTEVLHAQGCDNQLNDPAGIEEAVNIAQKADLVVLVLGDRSGMTPDCTTGETRDSAYLRLPGVQEELAKKVISAGKPVVVVLVSGRPYAIPWIAENANAILAAWLPGDEGAYAVADILFGEANPGGKLPITFPRAVGQVPIFHSAKPSGVRSHWYTDYADELVKPLYPFGHGLSYTQFSYENLTIDRPTASAGETVNISLTVRNTGPLAGDEVVQLYTRDEYASLPRPLKELRGFVRVSLLPGEAKSITFRLPVDQLAFFDHDLQLVLEAGKISVLIGSSSEDIRLTGSFEITGPKKLPLQERVFFCPVEVA